MKKVLVWGLTNNRAGTEAVIVNYASRVENVSFDFLCYEEPLSHWEKLNKNGNRYFVIPSKIKNPFAYYPALSCFMKDHAGEYDVFWFNVNDAANIDPLKYAVQYAIPKRIVHMHNSQLSDSPLTRFFHGLNYKKLCSLGTDYWACSEAAALFLGDVAGSVRIVPNIVDAEKVRFSTNERNELRKQFGLDGSFVIGFVGRLSYQKHPDFLLEIMPSILEKNPLAQLVFVGEGDLKSALEETRETLGLQDKVHFVGSQENIQGFLSAFDVYAQPSRYEGLSLSILEAQFNGLPCVVSDALAQECDITTGIQHVPVTDRQTWIDALLQGDRSAVKLLLRSCTYDASTATQEIENLF